MELADIRDLTDKLQSDIAGLRGRCELLQSQVDKRQAEQKKLKGQQTLWRKAALLVQRAADAQRESLRQRFERTVSAALQSTFGGSYGFRITVEEKKNGTHAYFGIISELNREPQDPLFARGGSTVDVCSMALRLAYMGELGIPGPIILDEPSKHVSESYREANAQMIEQLHQITGRQMLIISHDSTLKQYIPNTIEL